MSVAANIQKIKEELPESVTIIAVSKTHPVERIQEAYDFGQRDFGENRVQELLSKQPLLPSDIRWHLIGHLQSNKVKYIAPFIHLIHSVDSLKLLETINKEGQKNNRVISCLLQFFIAREETKFGLDLDEALALLQSPSYQNMQHIAIRGVMGMASLTDNEQQIREEFRTLKSYFNQIQPLVKNEMTILSFGMSSDYRIAVEEGSTVIRVGSAIFGNR